MGRRLGSWGMAVGKGCAGPGLRVGPRSTACIPLPCVRCVGGVLVGCAWEEEGGALPRC